MYLFVKPEPWRINVLLSASTRLLPWVWDTDPKGRVIEELDSGESFFMVALNMDEVRRSRENGFMGMFPFFKLLRDFKEAGRPVDQCYLRGLENAPLFQTLTEKAPVLPSEIKRFGEK